MAAQQGADKITGEEELKKMSCTDFGEFKVNYKKAIYNIFPTQFRKQ